jgi:subtilisin family serine protease
MNRLDPRFETIAATGSPREIAESEMSIERDAWPPDLHPNGEEHRAFVLLQPGARLPDFFTGYRVQLNESVFIIEADLSMLRRLAGNESVVYIEAPRPMDEELDTSVQETHANGLWTTPTGASGLTGAGVVVGIIEAGGIDWKLLDFRLTSHPNDTRIIAIWDQSLKPASWEHSPAPYGYGVEYNQTAINNDLAGGTALRHRCANGSHATHVAGIAVGNGSSSDTAFPAATYIGVAHEADIVHIRVVKNPGTNLTSSDRVAEAIQYIYEKAGQRPCVINVSLGNNGGAHDSESVVERTIDRMLEARGRVMVKSAGNEGTWACHASATVTDVDPIRTLDWQFRDRTPGEMEVWYSSRDRLRIRIEDPRGNRATVEPAQYDKQVIAFGRDTVTICSERFHPLNGAGYVYIHVAFGPAAITDGELWKVIVEAINANDIRDGKFDAWIERVADRSRHQSYFKRYVDPENTISPPGTIRRGITVGNYEHTTNSKAASSSSGPTRDERKKPDFVAPGTGILSSGALGTQPNPAGGAFPVRVKKTGSSMSAPHVTGICAQLLQAFGDLTSAQVRAVLIASAASIGSTAFDSQLGFGKVDATEAERTLR